MNTWIIYYLSNNLDIVLLTDLAKLEAQEIV